MPSCSSPPGSTRTRPPKSQRGMHERTDARIRPGGRCRAMTDTAAPARPERRRYSLDMRALAPFIALAVLMVVGALVNPDFLSPANLLNVVTRSAFIAIIAVGATFVISGGGLDLSVGAMAAFVEIGRASCRERV